MKAKTKLCLFCSKRFNDEHHSHCSLTCDCCSQIARDQVDFAKKCAKRWGLTWAWVKKYFRHGPQFCVDCGGERVAKRGKQCASCSVDQVLAIEPAKSAA